MFFKNLTRQPFPVTDVKHEFTSCLLLVAAQYVKAWQ